MSDAVIRACGHTERVRLVPGLNSDQFMKAINTLRSQDCADCQRISMKGGLVRHWITPKDDVELPDSCIDVWTFSTSYGQKLASQIIAKYPDITLAGIVGLPDPIIFLDIPPSVDVCSISEEFNCAVYRKVAG